MRTNHLIPSGYRFKRWLILGVLTARCLVPGAASAEQRVIDTAHSTVTVHVFKSGLFRAFADNHVIQAPLSDGSIDDGASPHVRILVDARRMRVLDPGLSPKDREHVQTRMLGPEVLDATRFPDIRFQSVSVQHAGLDGWLVRGTVTLHGQTHVVEVKVMAEQGRYRGSVSLKQTDFGMSPISMAGGTVRVKDDVKVDFDIVASSLDRTRARNGE
jgi:hypothetical protein